MADGVLLTIKTKRLTLSQFSHLRDISVMLSLDLDG
jgi:hypothetical protein